MQDNNARIHVRSLSWLAFVMVLVGMGLIGFATGQDGDGHAGAIVTAGRAVAAGHGDSLPQPQAAEMRLGGMVLLFAAAGLLTRGRVSQTAENPLRDAPTGLYNRLYTDEVVPGMAARHDRSGESQLAMLLLKIDFLDDIRRRYGQAAVDAVLALLGRHVLGQSRDGDIAAHIDAERVVVFVRCQEVEQATAFGRRLSMLLAREQLDWRGDVIKITSSMGVVMRDLGESMDSLYERATANLNAARACGPNSIVS